MTIVGGLDMHRKQLTFDYLDTVTGEVERGRVAPADREHLRAWLARLAGRGDVAFALEGCTGWRYVAGELAAAGVEPHVAEPADAAFARGRKRHAKTDKTDSRHLRELLAAGRLNRTPGVRGGASGPATTSNRTLIGSGPSRRRRSRSAFSDGAGAATPASPALSLSQTRAYPRRGNIARASRK
jgi:hypothetical protein